MSTVRTTCPYCGVGCGVVSEGAILKGDSDHPANFGQLCSKGAALRDTLATPDRLLAPTIDGRETDWEEALSLIASEFQATIREHGPDAVAFYVSGQFLTEDYYVANKLMKGFMGSANIDTNSRLCMASSVAGHVRAFGEDVVPGCYEDIDQADLVVLVGSNMAWCHPVLYQRLLAARDKRNTKIVVIDPRRTASCGTADLHLPIAGGTDAILFNGLLRYLWEKDRLAHSWIAAHVDGFEESFAQAKLATIDAVSTATGVPADDIRNFYEVFAATERVVTLYSQGVNQSDVGTDKVNSILNCHLATGRIGRPGLGPFSLTGQPNAMGGREVGGLANQLAAHMAFEPESIDRVRRFWKAPNTATRPGLKAVDMFRAVKDGRIRAIWIAATNPANSMPNAALVRAALENCPLVVVSDAWATDTTARARIVLPAAAWAEKDGTVTNSERRISRQRPFRAAPGLARPDWWMFTEVARRMGWENAFDYDGPAAIFREHAALSAFENNGRRMFDLGPLETLDNEGYENLGPTQWPVRANRKGEARLFANGLFPTANARARMVPIVLPALAKPDGLRLNTGRVRDQWHTMTRTGRVPRLMTHTPEPLLHLHPNDAATYGLTEGMLARVTGVGQNSVYPVAISDQQPPGQAFLPMHWTDQFSSALGIGRIVHDRTDPTSGQPDLKGTPVTLEAVPVQWTGLLLRHSDKPLELDALYWAKAPAASGHAFRMAGWNALAESVSSEQILRRLLDAGTDAEILSYSDPKRQIFRYASLLHGILEAVIYFAPAQRDLPSLEAITERWGKPIDSASRNILLAA